MTGRWTVLAAVSIGCLLVAAGCGSDQEQPEPGVDAFCERIAPLASLASNLESADPDLDGLTEDVRNAAAVAPPAVQPSIETIASALATMSQAAAASGEEGQAALAAAFAAIEGEREALERASDVVEGYAERECGVDLSPGDAGETGSSDAPPNETTP